MDPARFLESGRPIELDGAVGDRPICIVDSSFNPPNYAHMKLAQIGLAGVPNAVVLLLLATGNADKPAIAPEKLAQRVDLMRCAASSIDPTGKNVRIGLTTAPYFIDKAAALRELGGNRLIFMVGYDTIVRFVDQKYYKEDITTVLDKFFALAEMMVLTRHDTTVQAKLPLTPSEQLETAAQLVGEKHKEKVHFVLSKEDTAEVSSTRARQSLDDLRECCPPQVVEYVVKNDLYG